jgi:hypothetical protein
MGYSADKAWYQQGGMKLHTAAIVLDFSEETFGN